MNFRIYIDESGTHSDQWLIIGMLFVPTHGALHSDLCAIKEKHGYLNQSPKHSARYKETHLTKFKSARDVAVAKDWIDAFLRHDCYYRCVAIDWSTWDGSYFGTPFEPEALQKRRAYKKWAEMLLQPELREPTGGRRIVDAKLYLDRLRIMAGYDVLEHLRERFTANYRGSSPYIQEFQHTDSKLDANQCLQLCDVLTGCLYQSLVPASQEHKVETKKYLAEKLSGLGVKAMTAGGLVWKS